MSAHILVADDCKEISSFLADYLAMMGHVVTVVDNGANLLSQAIARRPHLIITDIQMPGGSGSSAYLSLQQDEATRNIPFIFISAHPADRWSPDTLSTRSVQKPLDHEKLSRFIAELLPLGGYRV